MYLVTNLSFVFSYTADPNVAKATKEFHARVVDASTKKPIGSTLVIPANKVPTAVSPAMISFPWAQNILLYIDTVMSNGATATSDAVPLTINPPTVTGMKCLKVEMVAQ